MPVQRFTQDIAITAGGGTASLPVTDNFQYYYLNAAGVTLTSSWTIEASGTPEEFMLFQFKFKGALNLNSETFTVFGVAMPQNLLNGDLEIDCYYNGSAWEVTPKPSFTNTEIIAEDNLGTEVVTVTKVGPLAITGAKIANDTISATKLDASGKKEFVTVRVSFETGYIGAFYKIYFPYACTASFASGTVETLIEATNDATVTFTSSLGLMTGTLTFTAGDTAGQVRTAPLSGGNCVIADDSYVTFTTAKVTAGGEALLTFVIIRA